MGTKFQARSFHQKAEILVWYRKVRRSNSPWPGWRYSMEPGECDEDGAQRLVIDRTHTDVHKRAAITRPFEFGGLPFDLFIRFSITPAGIDVETGRCLYQGPSFCKVWWLEGYRRSDRVAQPPGSFAPHTRKAPIGYRSKRRCRASRSPVPIGGNGFGRISSPVFSGGGAMRFHNIREQAVRRRFPMGHQPTR